MASVIFSNNAVIEKTNRTRAICHCNMSVFQTYCSDVNKAISIKAKN